MDECHVRKRFNITLPLNATCGEIRLKYCFVLPLRCSHAFVLLRRKLSEQNCELYMMPAEA